MGLRTTTVLVGVLVLALSLAGAEQTELLWDQRFDVETLPGEVWELKVPTPIPLFEEVCFRAS